jgi:hypothetical protein
VSRRVRGWIAACASLTALPRKPEANRYPSFPRKRESLGSQPGRRHSREGGNPSGVTLDGVIPAKAGISWPPGTDRRAIRTDARHEPAGIRINPSPANTNNRVVTEQIRIDGIYGGQGRMHPALPTVKSHRTRIRFRHYAADSYPYPFYARSNLDSVPLARGDSYLCRHYAPVCTPRRFAVGRCTLVVRGATFDGTTG